MLICCSWLAESLSAQDEMTNLGNINYKEIYGESIVLNDIWGYAAEGREYALVGTTIGLSIVDVTEPTIPEELFFINGPQSTWRDIKTALGHAYVTNETGEGMLIVDLTNLPDTINHLRTTVNDSLWKAHNIFIDEFNIAYLAGFNNITNSVPTPNSGVMMLDLNENPQEPVYLNAYTNHYVHDVYVRNNLMYTSEIYQGQFAIVDVNDKNNPQVLGTKTTPNLFTHNAWLSDDGQYIFTTDEKANSYVASYDISNYNEIQELDRIQSSPGENVIPHNVHVYNDFLIVSYYQDGIVVLDASQPDLLIETEFFDSSISLSGSGFGGCWGVYPFLPSGTIIASDRQEGLVVLSASYQHAGYLRGSIADSETGESLSGVEVKMWGDSQKRYSDFFGNYKTGYIAPNTKTVRFSKIGYETKDVFPVDFVPGETQYINVTLNPLPTVNIALQIEDASNGELIQDAQLQLFNEDFQFEGTTNMDGMFGLENILPMDYTLYVGKWGYETKMISTLQLSESGTQTIMLTPKYFDDFFFDFNWQSEDEIDEGSWTWGDPIGTTNLASMGNCNPEFDLAFDNGNLCYVTGNDDAGNASNFDLTAFDVDGINVLRSPSMNLSEYPDPYVSFYLWICSSSDSNTKVKASVSNGIEVVDLQVWNSVSTADWEVQNYRLTDFIDLTENMTFELTASDIGGDDILEVGIDLFQISDEVVISPIGVGLEEEVNNALKITTYPNPFEDENVIVLENARNHQVRIFDAVGRLVLEKKVINNQENIRWGQNLPSGIYMLQVGTEKEQKHQKVVKF